MLSRLANAVTAQKHEIEERLAINEAATGRFLTEIAAKLVWIRQQINKVQYPAFQDSIFKFKFESEIFFAAANELSPEISGCLKRLDFAYQDTS